MSMSPRFTCGQPNQVCKLHNRYLGYGKHLDNGSTSSHLSFVSIGLLAHKQIILKKG